jgi:ribosomal protein S6--L-glutamate ligase
MTGKTNKSASNAKRIVILSRNRKLYSTSRLFEAAKSRGVKVSVIDPLRCYMRISVDGAQIHYRGRRLKDVAAIIPRIGASVTFYATAVVRQFEMMGIYTPNSSDAIQRARDKLKASQLLSQAGVNMPLTVFGDSPDDTKDLLNMLGKTPHVIKLVEGTQGQGVVLAETRSASESLIEAFRGLQANFLVQEFVKEAKGADIRAFVVGGKVIAAMRRQAKAGEFRSNLHRGASAAPIKISKQERQIAVRAAQVMGLGVAGVDLIQSERGPLVLEVNSSPGLEGIEGATQVDVAGAIIEHIVRQTGKGGGLRIRRLTSKKE